MLLEQLKNLGVSTFKAEVAGKSKRENLELASEFELEKIQNRKEVYKDSEILPETKQVAKEANYDNEVRKSVADDVADQDENIAVIGDKTNYRGALYRTG